MIYAKKFRLKNYIPQIQQKRLPKAQASLTEALLHVIENELSLMFFSRRISYKKRRLLQ